MNLHTAESYMQRAGVVAVMGCGWGMPIRTGKIVSLHRRQTGATVAWYATIRWSRPMMSGAMESDAKINRVQTIAAVMARVGDEAIC